MGGCCSCCGKNNVRKKTIKKDSLPENKSNSKNVIIYSQDDSSKEQTLISREKLNQELKNAIKAGDSAYCKQLKKVSNKVKTISDSQYNKKGLVDEQSKEFREIKEFLQSRNYGLICSIGSGNYAEVYKASSAHHNKKVAIKVIHLTETSRHYRLNFLPQEVQILKVCKHPNIIKMYQICQTKNLIFMIMEYAENGTLADWLLNNGALTESMANAMFTKILEAIHHMHSRMIAHRDLKLENILVTSTFQPKISDFSYAIKVDPAHPHSNTHCGSLPYFAPELLQKKAYNPLISDIWSLGVCFYIMLNDGLPFKIGNDSLMLDQQLNRGWKFRAKVESQISPELKCLIKKMLEPDTNKRIKIAQIMEDSWVKNYADSN